MPGLPGRKEQKLLLARVGPSQRLLQMKNVLLVRHRSMRPVQEHRPDAPPQIPGPRTSSRQQRPIVRSEMVRSPKARLQPMSIPKDRPTSNDRSDTAPSPLPRLWDSMPD